jgi:hypothetical protein
MVASPSTSNNGADDGVDVSGIAPLSKADFGF